MSTPQMQHRASSGSQSDNLDFLQEQEYFDPNNLGSWKQEEYFDESLLMPSHSGEHEKHYLPELEREQPDNKRQEVGTLDSGKKKPGRKPIMNEPTTKRKAQNRAAQRAFRERKENHVKDLETRVQELEQQNFAKSTENDYLKAELDRLRGGLGGSTFARTEDFTFAFASPASVRHQSSSSASGVSPSSEFLTRSSDCPSLSSSQTSPQSVVEGDFNAAAMPFFASQPRKPSLHKSDTAVSGTSQASTSFSRTSGPSALEMQAAKSPVDRIFSETFSMPEDKALSFDPMSYRDNSIFDNYDVDPTLFDTSNGFMDPLQMDSNVDFFLPLNDKSKEQQQPTEKFVPKQKVDISAFEASVGRPDGPCDEVWRKITTHPKFPIFDLDDLCSEFRAKATCTKTLEMKKNEKHSAEAWQEFDQDLDDFAARQERKLLI